MLNDSSTAQEQKDGVPAGKGADLIAPTQEQTKEESNASDRASLTSKANAKKEKKSSTIPSKRKAKASDEPSKNPRRSARGVQQVPVDPAKMIQFLLSSESLDLCRPKDEIEDLNNRGDIKTYSSSVFSPFEELVCAVVLSRPISHALGLRSIRTIFNDPYNFTTPNALREAGSEGRRKALDVARTQHRQKTADELGLLADQALESIGDGEHDVSLEKVRNDGDHDAAKERDILKKNVKGLGKTGLDIFGRRIQEVWPEFYPFVDQKTSSALMHLGLPGDAEELKDLIGKSWSSLQFEIEGTTNGDDEFMRRKAFVRILERAVGAALEGNAEAVKPKAA